MWKDERKKEKEKRRKKKMNTKIYIQLLKQMFNLEWL